MTELEPSEKRLHETRGKKKKRWRVLLPHLLKGVMLMVYFIGAVFRILNAIQRMFGD